MSTPESSEKTIAQTALCRLMAAPLPQTVQEFRQHTLMALLTGRQIESDFAVNHEANTSIEHTTP